mmetsp:Transcript_82798/g.146284  ORF Transcript_82798/g.146284 Transcript_82798/m.146284 type:complete len:198 (+) Transcript_82798:42-635(+)
MGPVSLARLAAWTCLLRLAYAEDDALTDDCGDEALSLLQRSAFPLQPRSYPEELYEEQAGTAAIVAWKKTGAEQASSAGGASGVGLMEEQNAKYIVAGEFREPQLPELMQDLHDELSAMVPDDLKKAVAKGADAAHSLAEEGLAEAAAIEDEIKTTAQEKASSFTEEAAQRAMSEASALEDKIKATYQAVAGTPHPP